MATSPGPMMCVIAQIALDMPPKATSGDLMAALVRAELAGYERCLRERGEPLTDPRMLSSLLRPQAG